MILTNINIFPSPLLILLSGEKRATKHDILATYSPLFKHTKIFSNAGWTGEEAAAAIKGTILSSSILCS